MNIDRHHTAAVHAGQTHKGYAEFPVPSLILNSAVLLESVQDGWDMLTFSSRENIAYQRYANPTVSVLERKIAAMEGSQFGLATNSGMTACLLLFRALLNSGDHIVTQHSLYHEITDQILDDKRACGIECTIISEYSVNSFDKAFKPNTKMVFVESPTNPVMLDVDLRELATLCQSRGVILVVDNTLLTFALQKPLGLGAAISLYSTTKAIAGHGDAIGGILTTNSADLYGKLKAYRDNTGLVLDPFSAFLTVRGVRTLQLRIDRQSENAEQVLSFLATKWGRLQTVYPTHTNFFKANAIRKGGGVFSLILPSRDAGRAFIDQLKMIRIGTTFGNLESLCYCFGAFARPTRDISKIGIPLGLVRISCGIEDAEDIVNDIDQSLERCQAEGLL